MSSKRAVRRRQCEGKVAHASAKDAESHARWMQRDAARSGAVAPSVSVYHCPFCGKWHVGHTPRRVRQAAAAKGAHA